MYRFHSDTPVFISPSVNTFFSTRNIAPVVDFKRRFAYQIVSDLARRGIRSESKRGNVLTVLTLRSFADNFFHRNSTPNTKCNILSESISPLVGALWACRLLFVIRFYSCRCIEQTKRQKVPKGIKWIEINFQNARLKKKSVCATECN